MIDNEIIKAWECCTSERTNSCFKCPFYKLCDDDNFFLVKATLDLINRQKAEIERLNKQLEELSFLENRVNGIKNTPEDTFSGAIVSMAKGVGYYEAVKEFAERLKVLCRHARFSVTVTQDLTGIQRRLDNIAVVDENDIDNLVKEMVGEG